MGNEQRNDESRVKGIFAAARKLPERPIGEDGGDRGVVQFIGINQDMALFMVEAGENVRQHAKWAEENEGDEMEVGETSIDEKSICPTLLLSDDSPLSSLGATPTPTRESFSDFFQKSAPGKQSLSVQSSTKFAQSLEEALQSTRSYLDSSTQALILDVDVSHKSFLPPSAKIGRGASLGKDLKLEVYVNGELTNVEFINARRSAVQIVNGSLRYTGTRLHRQLEKPWIYVPTDEDESMIDADDAERRWACISKSLISEAELRGRDGFGDIPPSAEYLIALAALGLPERLKGRQGLGVIDLVLTAGKGKKYGPETSYITGPTKMHDPGYTTANHSIDPALLAMSVFRVADDVSPLRDPPAPESSPDIPLRRTRQTQADFAASPTPKRNMRDIQTEFGLDFDVSKTTIGGYENARGQIVRTRTLGQRLGDIRKMSDARRTEELEKLKADYSTKDDFEPVKKRTRIDSFLSHKADPDSNEFNLALLADTALSKENETVDPTHLFRSLEGLPESADADAELTGDRIALALKEGAPSDGHLIRRIASMSPQRKPQKKTQASSLANSPASVPIKEPKKKGRPQTPKHDRSTEIIGRSSRASSYTAPNKTRGPQEQTSPTRSGAGANRSAKKFHPNEKTPAEVLKDFVVPESCKGSCVTYAEDENAQRQIGKARRGEFREEMLLVGMRFVVT